MLKHGGFHFVGPELFDIMLYYYETYWAPFDATSDVSHNDVFFETCWEGFWDMSGRCIGRFLVHV